jgi:PncC family amidohydrolase
LLAERRKRIVLAESCTAGLISASLAGVPGISDYLCGSAVTYRDATKAAWLDVPASRLADPGPVSQAVARDMVEGVLCRTPEADMALSITGHLGPDSPPELDGLVFVAVAIRAVGAKSLAMRVHECRLTAIGRVSRQCEAAALALEQLRRALASLATGPTS